MAKILSFYVIIGLSGFISVSAQNPICPPGVYIADPSAHVWDDGKLYIYGSTDQSCDYYCSWHHDVMVTSDMSAWEIEKDVFASRDQNDRVAYNDNLLYAPDCALRNGTYYLYYCQPDRKSAEGVAASDSPTGPFGEGSVMNINGYNQIDPSVFIDDDGTAYYVWGQFTMKMARLMPDMRQLHTASIRDSILTESEHFFHEGAFMTKRNGMYYLVYADISREDKPTCIGYATSSSPFGPYSYGGVIVDNSGCNPGNWNNHGSICEFNGQWYVFYHRSTHGCNKMRKACVEKITFLPDGSIPEVAMTSQGAGGPLDATSNLDAAMACLLHGNARVQAESTGNEILTGIVNGDVAIFKFIDFKDGIRSVSIRIRSKAGGTLVVKPDKGWYHSLTEVSIDPGGPGAEWKVITLDASPVNGIHALWLEAHGGEGELFDIDWITFNR